VKKPVGRPQRPCNLEVSLVPYVPPLLSKPSIVRTKRRARGAYTNWFTPKLWPPIVRAMKQHKNVGDALSYL
jgi:hypothetical protein